MGCELLEERDLLAEMDVESHEGDRIARCSCGITPRAVDRFSFEYMKL
jgi:hypothetical protein